MATHLASENQEAWPQMMTIPIKQVHVAAGGPLLPLPHAMKGL